MTRTTAAALLCAAGVMGLTPGSASAQNREHQQMAAELRILQEQNQLLSVAIQKAMAQLEETTKAVKALNGRLDESDAATRKMFADQKLVVDSLATELRIIKERTQDSSARLGTLTEEVEALRGSVAALAVPAPVVAYDPFTGLPIEGPPPASSASAAPSAPPIGISPTRLYQEAWVDYTAAKYEWAIQGFQEYVRTFPTYEQADDAQLHIGDSYLALRKWPEAIQAFKTLMANYPNGDAVPHAYVGLGQAQRGLGQYEEARASWNTVIRMFKDTSAAIMAGQHIQGLPPPSQRPVQP